MATAQASPPDMSVEQQQAVLVALTLLAMAPQTPDVASAVEAILAPVGIAADAARAAALLGFAAPMLAPPRATPDTPPGPAVSQTTRTAPARRAAYVFSAAKRIDQALRDAPRMLRAADALEETGNTDEAQRLREQAETRAEPETAERRFLAQHLAAERARVEAAARVDETAAVYGGVLGWRARMDERTTPACRAAHGRNFDASRPPTLPRIEDGVTITGFPGTPHGGSCRCVAAPPFPGAPLLA